MVNNEFSDPNEDDAVKLAVLEPMPIVIAYLKYSPCCLRCCVPYICILSTSYHCVLLYICNFCP